jgi:hypothetical protein
MVANGTIRLIEGILFWGNDEPEFGCQIPFLIIWMEYQTAYSDGKKARETL